jgi:hypothetical protein
MKSTRDPVAASSAFRCLVQLCLAELRGDVGRLFDSGWAAPERARILELATVLDEACERQKLLPLALLARSMARLVGLSREEALPLIGPLRKKFKEMFHHAEQCLSLQRRTG